MDKRWLVGCLVVALIWCVSPADAKRVKRKKKKVRANVTKLISKRLFKKALLKLAADRAVPVASSTMVENGRGKGYYGESKLMDEDVDSFWAEGSKGYGKNQWVAFPVQEETTHVDIFPGAGKELFENFNRPKKLFLDLYLVNLKRKKGADDCKPKFRFLGRTNFEFEDKPIPVRRRVPVGLPILDPNSEALYVAVIILKKVYKGQFNDTAISEVRSSVFLGD